MGNYEITQLAFVSIRTGVDTFADASYLAAAADGAWANYTYADGKPTAPLYTVFGVTTEHLADANRQ
jgi:hypothetical protein